MNIHNILRISTALSALVVVCATVCRADETLPLSDAASSSAQISVTSTGCKIDFPQSGGYPSVFWKAPAIEGYNWSGHNYLAATPRNPTTEDVQFCVRLDDEINTPCEQTADTVHAGQTQTFLIPRSAPPGKHPTGEMLQSSTFVDLKHVSEFQLFLSAPKQPTSLELQSATLNPGGQSPVVPFDKPFLSPVFGDNMVLQRDAKDKLWGWTQPGTTISLKLAGKTYSAKADSSGKWTVSTNPLPAGGPYTIDISGPKSLALHNILMGDVWLCSGQSNMAFGVNQTANSKEAIADANYPNIRLFYDAPRTASSPKDTLILGKEATQQCWRVCSPDTVASTGWSGFPAVAYFFARHLNKSLNVPIGLIANPQGGMPIETFMSPESLKSFPEFKQQIAMLKSQHELYQVTPAVEAGLESWYKKNDPGIASSPSWASPRYDDSAWSPMTINQWWSPSWTPALAKFTGIIWYRTTFNAPARWVGQPLTLSLANITDCDTAYVNGVEVGRDFAGSHPYTVSRDVVVAGQNTISVRILDVHDSPGYYGLTSDLWISIKDSPDSKIMLSNPWKYEIGHTVADRSLLPAVVDPAKDSTPTLIYNATVAPLIPMAIKGVVWYQGEAQVAMAGEYRQLLKEMIFDYRSKFQSAQLPFYIVQLPSYGKGDTSIWSTYWAQMREAQLLTSQQVPNTGLAVTIDVGDPNNVHPTNKEPVGDRLALSAMANTYGQKLEYSGPMYQSMNVDGGAISVHFTHAEGLVAKGESLKGFMIAGSDNKFVPATAKIDGATVVVSSPEVPSPTQVRYAWEGYSECNLYNSDGLPTCPFRTDSLPLL